MTEHPTTDPPLGVVYAELAAFLRRLTPRLPPGEPREALEAARDACARAAPTLRVVAD